MPEAPPSLPTPPDVSLRQRWSARRLLLLTLVLLLADTIVQILVMVTTGWLFAAAGAGSLAALALLVTVVHASGGQCRRFCGWSPLTGESWTALLLLAAGSWYPVALLSSWSSALYPPPPEFLASLRAQLPRSPGGIVLTAVVVVGLAPLAEEILFRALLYRICRRRWSVAMSAVVSGLLFALAHGEPWYLFGLFPLGILLAVVLETTGSLAAPWLVHAAFNAVSLSLMLRWPEASLQPPASPPTPHPWPLAASLVAWLVGLFRLRRSGRRASPLS